MGILFTILMGFLLTITMGILFTIVLGIQLTISTVPDCILDSSAWIPCIARIYPLVVVHAPFPGVFEDWGSTYAI